MGGGQREGEGKADLEKGTWLLDLQQTEPSVPFPFSDLAPGLAKGGKSRFWNLEVLSCDPPLSGIGSGRPRCGLARGGLLYRGGVR